MEHNERITSSSSLIPSHGPEELTGDNDMTSSTSISRRALLTTGAKVAAGLAGGGVALAAMPPSVLADRDRMRSIAVLRKPAVTLNFTFFGNVGEGGTWEQLAKMFHAQNPNITVKVVPVPATAWSEYFQKVLTMIAGGNSPDICRIATEGAKLFAAKDLALPLDDFIKRDAKVMDDYLSDVSPKLTETFKYNGKTLALPFEWNDWLITYNTKVFRQAGVAAPKANWTSDDFLAAAKKITKGSVYGCNLWQAPGTFYISGWLTAAGGGLLNKDWTKSNATNPVNIKAMQFVQDLVWKNKVAPRPGSPDFPLLEAGRVGMITAGRWAVNTFILAKWNDYNVQLAPILGPGRKTTFGVGAHPILKNAKYPEEAWTFLKYLSTRPAMAYTTKNGYSNPSRRSVANDPSLMVPPGNPGENWRAYYGALDSAESLPAPAQFNEMESALIAAYTKMIANETTPAQMLQSLDSQINTILAKPV